MGTEGIQRSLEAAQGGHHPHRVYRLRVADPFMIRALPAILSGQEGIVFTRKITGNSAVISYFQQVVQFEAILIALVLRGSVADERSSGVYSFLFAKPYDRMVTLASKGLVYAVIVSAGAIMGGAVVTAYAGTLFPESPPVALQVLNGSAFLLLALVFYSVFAIGFSAILTNGNVAFIASFALFWAPSLAPRSLPLQSKLGPHYLTTQAFRVLWKMPIDGTGVSLAVAASLVTALVLAHVSQVRLRRGHDIVG
ncbi:MAG: ABC transporter permease [Bacillota bacterium]